MRIIAGEFRSRTLEAPPGLATRPTSDRLRETLFNIIAPRIEGSAFLDLYAGSGAVGIEALSRGAARVVLVERASEALTALRANLARFGLRSMARVQAGNVAAFLRRGRAGERVQKDGAKFDLIFLDPPWDATDEYAATLGLLGGTAAGLLARDAMVIAEHRKKQPLEDRYGKLKRTRLLEQGDAALSFYAAGSGDLSK